MITVLWPCDRGKVWISSTWQQHLQRPGYKREYAGTDLAGPEQPLRASQYGGRVLQAHFSTEGYGYTTFVDYGGVLRVRNAHQKNVDVLVGQEVNAGDYLGMLDSTGNSTGNHTHFEVWLKYEEGWRNIDPLDQIMGVKLVNDVNLLEPLGAVVGPLPEPQFAIPEFPTLPKVKTTVTVTMWLNLRAQPKSGSADLGDVKPGEIWEAFGSYVDNLGNIWLALKKENRVGWAAGYYNGQTWLEVVEQC